MNKYPVWKYILVLVVVIFGTLYSLPNLFGEDYAVQITSSGGRSVSEQVLIQRQEEIKSILNDKKISYKSIELDNNNILVRLNDSDEQLAARKWIKAKLGDDYIVALNLASSTPSWLRAIGANPMKLGLDLRGGVHFLVEVDVKAALNRYLESDLEEIRKQLREEKIRYRGAYIRNNSDLNTQEVIVRFKTQEDLDQATKILSSKFSSLIFDRVDDTNNWLLSARFTDQEKIRVRNYAMEQSITTLRKRVNELGVAEAIVQRQGSNRIAVELPGIQDTARAKDIIGKTATVEFRLAYPDRNYGSTPPVGYTFLARQDSGLKEAVKNDVIITGESIIGAYADFDPENGSPTVQITLGGSQSPIRKFSEVTLENVQKPMATIYVETKVRDDLQADGSIQKVNDVKKEIISVATIQQGLGKRFQITGLRSMQEAKNLALLLRAGALPAPAHIVSERTIGPSLGKENIQMGLNSVFFGMLLVLVFMAIYYRVFGLIADVALFMNLVLLVAICSMIDVTMTLPGIAGIVLTLGMAVDANVLIFERIREEMRLGTPLQASIKSGYEKAFATIVDANVTTLIAAVVLFSIGSGAVKGFAVTLTIGLLTSMFTAITGSRALVNLIFGSRRLKSLPIGI